MRLKLILKNVLLCRNFGYMTNVKSMKMCCFFIITGTIIIIMDNIQKSKYSEDEVVPGYLVKSPKCKIPDLDIYSDSVRDYITKPKPLVCKKGKPPLVDSNLTSIFLLESSFPDYFVKNPTRLKCCYQNFSRMEPEDEEDLDDRFKISRRCIKLRKKAVIKHEFIRVSCFYNKKLIYYDFFAFVPRKVQNIPIDMDKAPLNVLIVGLDSISRLNFHRQMPKTATVLKDLSAVEMLGYNKVGDNTFPNLIPVLTGLSEEELTTTCWPHISARFDDCPFIWKKFSQKGFVTSFAEDASWMGIFNYYKNGFLHQPTDYMWGVFNFVAEIQLGGSLDINVAQCIGSRPVFRTMLDYMKNFIQSMSNYKQIYFGFFWETALGHDDLNTPRLGDKYYAQFFRHLEARGVLNNTVVIFMSDHGIRWGDIRLTYQGIIEERLPFLFFMFPKWYQERYITIYKNLQTNTRRLTTPFDLHETIKDLLDPYNVPTKTATRKQRRAYSLFEPIPRSRTCDDADISSHWCTCNEFLHVNPSDDIAREATEYAVYYINRKLDDYSQCANLTLKEVINVHAQEEQHSNVTQAVDYTVVFTTIPGNAIFEATIMIGIEEDDYHFAVKGTISRLNLYKDQSYCVEDFRLKLYCFCMEEIMDR